MGRFRWRKPRAAPTGSGPISDDQPMSCDERSGQMRIEETSFGNITIDGKTYDHDVVIRLDS